MHEVQKLVEIELDEEDGDDTIETYSNRIKKSHWNPNGL